MAEDPERTTWAAYGNEYWPANYVVDRAGRPRAHHVGEGGAGIVEDAVRRFLAEGGAPGPGLVGTPSASERPPIIDQGVTPELYLGSGRGLGSIAGTGPVNVDERVRRADRGATGRNQVRLTGAFLGADEWVQAEIGSRLEGDFRARDVYVTARAGTSGAIVEVLLNGAALPPARRGRDVVGGPRGTTITRLERDDLRHLLTEPLVVDDRLTLTVRGAPTRFYTLTFGG